VVALLLPGVRRMAAVCMGIERGRTWMAEGSPPCKHEGEELIHVHH
jgi:hypothetical protein